MNTNKTSTCDGVAVMSNYFPTAINDRLSARRLYAAVSRLHARRAFSLEYGFSQVTNDDRRVEHVIEKVQCPKSNLKCASLQHSLFFAPSIVSRIFNVPRIVCSLCFYRRFCFRQLARLDLEAGPEAHIPGFLAFIDLFVGGYDCMTELVPLVRDEANGDYLAPLRFDEWIRTPHSEGPIKHMCLDEYVSDEGFDSDLCEDLWGAGLARVFHLDAQYVNLRSFSGLVVKTAWPGGVHSSIPSQQLAEVLLEEYIGQRPSLEYRYRPGFEHCFLYGDGKIGYVLDNTTQAKGERILVVTPDERELTEELMAEIEKSRRPGSVPSATFLHIRPIGAPHYHVYFDSKVYDDSNVPVAVVPAALAVANGVAEELSKITRVMNSRSHQIKKLGRYVAMPENANALVFRMIPAIALNSLTFYGARAPYELGAPDITANEMMEGSQRFLRLILERGARTKKGKWGFQSNFESDLLVIYLAVRNYLTKHRVFPYFASAHDSPTFLEHLEKCHRTRVFRSEADYAEFDQLFREAGAMSVPEVNGQKPFELEEPRDYQQIIRDSLLPATVCRKTRVRNMPRPSSSRPELVLELFIHNLNAAYVLSPVVSKQVNASVNSELLVKLVETEEESEALFEAAVARITHESLIAQLEEESFFSYESGASYSQAFSENENADVSSSEGKERKGEEKKESPEAVERFEADKAVETGKVCELPEFGEPIVRDSDSSFDAETALRREKVSGPKLEPNHRYDRKPKSEAGRVLARGARRKLKRKYPPF